MRNRQESESDNISSVLCVSYTLTAKAWKRIACHRSDANGLQAKSHYESVVMKKIFESRKKTTKQHINLIYNSFQRFGTATVPLCDRWTKAFFFLLLTRSHVLHVHIHWAIIIIVKNYGKLHLHSLFTLYLSLDFLATGALTLNIGYFVQNESEREGEPEKKTKRRNKNCHLMDDRIYSSANMSNIKNNYDEWYDANGHGGQNVE